MEQSIQVIRDALPTLLQGLLITLWLTAATSVIGLILGSLLGIARVSASAPLRFFARAYIDFFRGTPLLVQLLIIYFGIPGLLATFNSPIRMERWVAAIVALSLNAAAYIGEIVRGGIQSIEAGQREASESLGLSRTQTMRYIIFPQAFRRMIPPLGNEFISLLKDTSLVSVISYQELLQSGRIVVARTYRAFEIYIAVAVIYLILILLASRVIEYVERRMNPVERAKRKPASASANMSIDGGDHPAEL
ncbi:amino acid ABC transporter permease [Microcoleus sp. FACHB-1515]|uniref:amino acid ABC transporter permease n=1 Tax=Cyanophyceae TaxID=3028117 RepID=UPI001688490C|nr:amino acid ABC transporter permease [Microcoleus sp. FACHB-1515]MBD2091476.1 amino acid ABC transporter permease [Microcoleus sp. FACHB-1515]